MTCAYYNEFDPKAAAWLRELIDAGLIAPGEVDERSITDVRPDELVGYTQCHFFAGIGGWSYALRLAGWPDDRPVWTGSCPCQPYSSAGARAGADDPRNLWWAFRWHIDQCRPATVFGEQVASADGREWLAGVSLDLEQLGYQVGAADLCAAGVGAPHIRQRLWWVGLAASDRLEGQQQAGTAPGAADGARAHDGMGHTDSAGRPGCGIATNEPISECSDDGLPNTDMPERDERPRGGEQPLREFDAGDCGGVADTGCIRGDQGGCSAPRQTPGGRTSSGAARRGERGRLGNSGSAGTGRNAGAIPGEKTQGDSERLDPWGIADCLVIAGADGKARRIKSGIEPLVDGLPGRVGLLRGYGNAIVPQVAAEFIKAVKEQA